jgi:hypothetical protein
MANPEQAEPSEPKLPMVISPKLDGSDETDSFDATSEDAGASPNGEANAAALSRSLRFALLAGSVAAAAALGSFVGALSASGVMRLYSEPGRHAAVATAPQAAQPGKAELAELSALKAGVDGASRNTNGQFAKLGDRIDRIERMQIEAATKTAHVADAVDRLEKKSVVAAAAAATPPALETTGSIAAMPQFAPATAKAEDKILPDWIVQDVRGGHALVENSRGGVFDVAAGATLPALGRVETIKRQDGQWVVVTAGGLITQHNEVK